jgi:hypothetical protein
MANKPAEPIDALTAELRIGRLNWRALRPYLTRYVLPEAGEVFDWQEVRTLVRRIARAEPPERTRPAA